MSAETLAPFVAVIVMAAIIGIPEWRRQQARKQDRHREAYFARHIPRQRPDFIARVRAKQAARDRLKTLHRKG